MTIQYFGEFLVHKNIINDDQLVDVLIEQMTSQPTFAQVAKEKKILTSQELMTILKYQIDQKVDFITSGKKLDIINLEREKVLRDFVDEVRTPIGQILIAKNLMNLKTLTSMLDEYLSQDNLKASEPSLINDQEPDQAVNKINIKSPNLINLEEGFDERKKRLVKVALTLIKDTNKIEPSSALKIFKDVYKIVHTLSGVMNVVGINSLIEMFEPMDKILGASIEILNEKKTFQMRTVDTLINAIDISWNLRNAILQDGDDSLFLKKNETLMTYENVKAEMMMEFMDLGI